MSNLNEDNLNLVFQVISYFTPAVFIVVGMPLALKLIGRNNWYGLRTPRTLQNETTWYAVNTVGGWAFVITGLVSITLIYWLFNSWQGTLTAKLLISVIVPIILMAIGLIFAFRAG